MIKEYHRVKAVIAYDGSVYFGFQRQTHTPMTITGEIEKALRALHIDSTIVGSGRTDAGVHATGQVIHFDIPPYWYDLKKLTLNLNRKLNAITFKHISFVPNDFHARFWAKKRLYRYIFKTSLPSIFEKKYISQYNSFDTKILKQALLHFEGKHDFNFFRKTGSPTHSSIREIYSANYISYGKYHIIYFQANGFLRSQVRMMIDAALSCAQNKMTIHELQEQIECEERYCTTLAPPEGLYLARVLY
jgi:tRNA pseudouridine38-40 synthase